jgi:dolichyl-diphosphooligosaccharide--protein glycosyltransferase
VILLVAVAVRLLPWPQVFTSEGVRFLADGDPYHHVLRAQALAAGGRVPWRDEGLNYPLGAEVPWPPLFDAVLAAAAWLLGAGRPTASLVEMVSAVVPVILGVLGVLAGWFLASRLLGARWALVAALFLAVSPASVAYGLVGRPDQHVLEALLLTAMVTSYVAGRRARSARERWAAAAATGALLCAAFWTWLGSALHLAVLCAIVAAEHVVAPDGDDRAGGGIRLARRAVALGAVLTAVTVLAFGPDGALARVTLGGVSAFPVVLLAGAAAWCALLERVARPGAGWRRRAGEVVLSAIAVSAAILALSPGAREAVARGLLAAGRGNSWYASIAEFRPLLFAPYRTFSAQALDALARFGLIPVLAVAGIAQAMWEWTHAPEHRARLVVLGTLGAVFTPLAAYMARFAYYAALPLALFGAAGVAAIARGGARLPRSWRTALAGAAVAAALVPSVRALTADAWRSTRFDAVARVLAPFRDGSLPSDGGLLVRWDAGHHARYFSGRPIVASPFGTEGGDGAMSTMAEFFLADDPAAAAATLARRGIRWILVEDPANAILDSVAFTGKRPSPVTVTGDRLRGFRIHCEASYDALVPARLYYEAGGATATNPSALGGFRLVSEVGPPGGPAVMRLFELVTGHLVMVAGALPGRHVVARVELTTALGGFPWTARAVADARGRAELRVPYATGPNGAVRASAYVVTDGSGTATIATTEAQVRRGGETTVEFQAGRVATSSGR